MFYFSGNIKIIPKTISDYLLINDYAFSNPIYRLTKKHITVEESTNTFTNSTLCLNKINIATPLENFEEVFIYRDRPIKSLKRCTKADGSAITLATFSLINNSDRSDLVKSGLVINSE